MANTSSPKVDLDASGSATRGAWGWFVALGVALLVLGVIAFVNLFAATLASVWIIGVLMLIAAAFHIVQAFTIKRWSGFFFWLLSGLLYGAVGALLIYDPVFGAAAITLTLAVALLVAGVFRIAVALRTRPMNGWEWLLAAGIITVLAGMIFLLGWPANTLWLLGIVLAIDLTFHGTSTLAFGLALRRGKSLSR